MPYIEDAEEWINNHNDFDEHTPSIVVAAAAWEECARIKNKEIENLKEEIEDLKQEIIAINEYYED